MWWSPAFDVPSMQLSVHDADRWDDDSRSRHDEYYGGYTRGDDYGRGAEYPAD